MIARIIYNEDETVQVLYSALKLVVGKEPESEQMERMFGKATPKDAVYQDIDENLLPDKNYINCWRGTPQDGVGIDIDKKKAMDDEAQRLSYIVDARQQAGFEKITIQQAGTKIDTLFAEANTIPLLKAAIVKTFKLILPFILK